MTSPVIPTLRYHDAPRAIDWLVEARAAGAEIVQPPQDQDYGGRNYTCRDLEGNVWSFGSYDPWSSA